MALNGILNTRRTCLVHLSKWGDLSANFANYLPFKFTVKSCTNYQEKVFIRFFKSKEEIYISLVEAKVEELFELLEREIAAAHSATEKISALIRVKLSYADRNRDFFRIYVSEWSGFEWTIKSAFGERVWKLYMNQVDLVAELIREGIQKGEFRLVDPKDAAFALHGMLNSTMYVWILQANPTGSLIEKGELIQTIFLNGIGKN